MNIINYQFVIILVIIGQIYGQNTNACRDKNAQPIYTKNGLLCATFPADIYANPIDNIQVKEIISPKPFFISNNNNKNKDYNENESHDNYRYQPEYENQQQTQQYQQYQQNYQQPHNDYNNYQQQSQYNNYNQEIPYYEAHGYNNRNNRMMYENANYQPMIYQDQSMNYDSYYDNNNNNNYGSNDYNNYNNNQEQKITTLTVSEYVPKNPERKPNIDVYANFKIASESKNQFRFLKINDGADALKEYQIRSNNNGYRSNRYARDVSMTEQSNNNHDNNFKSPEVQFGFEPILDIQARRSGNQPARYYQSPNWTPDSKEPRFKAVFGENKDGGIPAEEFPKVEIVTASPQHQFDINNNNNNDNISKDKKEFFGSKIRPMQYIFVPKNVNIMLSKPLSASFNVRNANKNNNGNNDGQIQTNGQWKAEVFRENVNK